MTKKLSTPFATSSTKRNDVPVTTTTAGQASYNIGFPDENFISLASGGIAPDGKDFNGVLFDITSNISDLNKGIPQYFDADFSALINGYGIGARLCLNDNSGYVVSTVANNTQDPNSALTGWSFVSIKNVLTIAELNTSIKSDGMIFNVKSYYAPNYALTNPYKGGGNFIYVDALKNTNNGVTIINGCVRQLAENVLTTYDAGLLGDGTDTADFQTTQLNNLFSCALNAMTIKIIGTFDKVTTNIFCQGVTGLKVDLTAGSITAPRSTWVWKTARTATTKADSNGNKEYYQRGLLCFFECPYTEVFGGVVKGAGLNNTTGLDGVDSWQDGDVGVQFHLSDFSSVYYCDVSNTFAWGIHATSSIGCSAYKNYVHDVYHQSGINLCMDSPINEWQKISIHSNTIDNVALYGVEFENYLNYFGADCYNNRVSNCYGGIVMSLGDNTTHVGNIYGNVIVGGTYGIWRSTSGDNRSDKSLRISDNTVSGAKYGIISQGKLVNTSIKSNTIRGASNINLYRKVSADFLILKILSSTQFLVQKEVFNAFSGSTGTWYVDGIAMTVASTVDSSETTGSVSTSGTLLQVTVNESVVTTDMLFHHLERLITAGTVGEAGILSDGDRINTNISDNDVSLNNYNYLRQSGTCSNPYDEFIDKNTFYKASIYDILINNSSDTNIRIGDGQVSGTTPNVIPNTLLSSLCIDTVEGRTLNFSTAKSSTASPVEQQFVHANKGAILGAIVGFIGGSTTGNITLRVANTSAEIATSTSSGANNQVVWFNKSIIVSSPTVFYITLSDTVGDLAYTSALVTLLYL